VERRNLPRADDRYPRARDDVGMDTNIDLRASDADREATADCLRRNHSEGRLDSEEFAARIDRCFDAKTIGELHQLVVDLPSSEPVRHVGAQVQRGSMFRAIWLLPFLFAAVSVAAHSGVWMLFRCCSWRASCSWAGGGTAESPIRGERVAEPDHARLQNPPVDPERQGLGRANACAVVE